MILKLLLVVGVVLTIYFLFIKKKPSVTNSNTNEKKTKKDVGNEMVECSSCGIYCEINDAILSNNKYYCSDECLKEA